MSTFKVGDLVEIVLTRDQMHEINNYEGKLEKGHVGYVTDISGYGSYKVDHEGHCCWIVTHGLKPAEDRSTWHPHHDVIVAWAKGAKVQYRDRQYRNRDLWQWVDLDEYSPPAWHLHLEYRVKPETDHTEEIAEIESKMRELSEAQKELADRLEKLK